MTRTGHTRITGTALRHTIEAVTAEAFGVPRGNVSAQMDDDAGQLAAAVTVQLAVPPLLGPRPDQPVSLFEKSRAARQAILDRAPQLTGMQLGRVDIRLSGAKTPREHQERRVA